MKFLWEQLDVLPQCRSPFIGNLGIKTVSIDSITPTSDFNFLTNHTSNINIGAIGYNTFIKENATVVNLTMSGILKTAIIQPPSLISQIEFIKIQHYHYILLNLGAVNNTISLFNNITTGIVQMCSNLVFQHNAIRSSGSSDAIDLFKNINGGSINIGNLLTTGSVNISNVSSSGTVNMCNSLVFKIRSIASSAVGDAITLFNNLTTGSITMGGTGKVSIGATVHVGATQSNINYNLGGGGATRTITTPSTGVFMYVFGANYNDSNITTTTFLSAGSATCRLFNQYIPPSFGITLTATGNQTFTISASFPASFNTFSASYVKLG